MDMGKTQHAVFCFSADIDTSLAGHFRAGRVRGISINVRVDTRGERASSQRAGGYGVVHTQIALNARRYLRRHNALTSFKRCQSQGAAVINGRPGAVIRAGLQLHVDGGGASSGSRGVNESPEL